MNRVASVALSPLSGLYGVAMKARRELYRRGLVPVREINVPVISVGNLTMGGTGKTPLVEWVAHRLAAANRRAVYATPRVGRAPPPHRPVLSRSVSDLSG